MSASPYKLTLLLALLIVSLVLHPAYSDPNTEVHELLVRFGFPKGLVPDSVSNYSISDDGPFVLELSESPCYVPYIGSLVHVSYDKKITGKVSYGVISELTGIRAFKLFFGTAIKKVTAKPAAGILSFEKESGLTESYPISLFQEVRSCRCEPFGLRAES